MQPDVLPLALSYLPVQPLSKCAQVCKSWHKIASKIQAAPLYLNMMHQMHKQYHQEVANNQQIMQNYFFKLAQAKNIAVEKNGNTKENILPFKKLQVLTQEASLMPIPRKCDVQELVKVHAKMTSTKDVYEDPNYTADLYSPYELKGGDANEFYQITNLTSSLFMCAMYDEYFKQIRVMDCTVKQTIGSFDLAGVTHLNMWFDAKDQQQVHAKYGTAVQRLAVFQLIAIAGQSVYHYRIVDVKLGKTSECSLELVNKYETKNQLKVACMVRNTGALFAYDTSTTTMFYALPNQKEFVTKQLNITTQICLLHATWLDKDVYGITLINTAAPIVYQYVFDGNDLVQVAQEQIVDHPGDYVRNFRVYPEQAFLVPSGRYFIFNSDLNEHNDGYAIFDLSKEVASIGPFGDNCYGLKHFGVLETCVFCNCDRMYVHRVATMDSKTVAVAPYVQYDDKFYLETMPQFTVHLDSNKHENTSTVSEIGYYVSLLPVHYSWDAEGKYSLLEIK